MTRSSWRHLQPVAAETERRQESADRRHAIQRRIEFRPLAEFQLADDLAGNIARLHDLNLSGNRFLVGGGAINRLFRLRTQEDVFASLDGDLGFGSVFRCDRINDHQRRRGNHAPSESGSATSCARARHQERADRDRYRLPRRKRQRHPALPTASPTPLQATEPFPPIMVISTLRQENMRRISARSLAHAINRVHSRPRS